MKNSHAIPGTDSRAATIVTVYGLSSPIQVTWGGDLRVCKSVIEAVQYLAANGCPDWSIR